VSKACQKFCPEANRIPAVRAMASSFSLGKLLSRVGSWHANYQRWSKITDGFIAGFITVF